MPLKLHNTLTGKLDEFTPMSDQKVTLYTCGPTVYDRLTVGNWSAYVYWDTLVRTLIADGYNVERVMNLTDVGHLVSDADEGEDKLEKGARREGKTAWEIAEFYAEDFMAGMAQLGLILPEHITKATDYIDQQLALVHTLRQKGYTYQTTDGIYFDTSKFPRYADFAHLDLAAQKAGARVDANDQKRQPWDFALWKFTPVGQKRDMEWETPADLLELGGQSLDDDASEEANVTSLASTVPDKRVTTGGAAPAFDKISDFSKEGADQLAGPAYSDLRSEAESRVYDGSGDNSAVMGFPGWHLECSAMAMDIFGPTIDIHTGGIDHIPVHHTNEIAQSEAATGKQFANYWLHNNHLKINGGKISKSLGNGYTLQDIAEHGFSPMDLRMFILQSQFMSEGNFTWDNMTSAKNRLQNWRNYAALRHQTHDSLTSDGDKNADSNVSLLATSGAVVEALNDNLNTPLALSIIDEAFDRLDNRSLDRVHRHGLAQLVETIDELLGLQLQQATPDITDEQKRRIIERERARDNKDWQKSDELRDQLLQEGIAVRDTPSGSVWEYTTT